MPKLNFFTMKEVAKIFHKTRKGINDNIHRGKFPGAIKVGTTWLIPKTVAVDFYNKKSKLARAKRRKALKEKMSKQIIIP
jgi:predicted DNA-binding protein YlxM (UPF0122 family)